MAGLYLVLGEHSPERIHAAAGRLKFFDEQVELVCEPKFGAAWVGHDDPALFGPALDPATGVRILCAGRVAWSEADWKRAESLIHFKGGLSCRLLLEAYLNRGAAALERHNGAAAVVVWDPRQQQVHLFSDHFGYHPIFLLQPERVQGAVISTFADAIADDPAVSVTSDELSMAELLSAWRVTPPHTYYREIKHAGAANVCTWNLAAGTYTKRAYWEPYREEPFPDLGAAAEELASATREAIRIRTLPHLSPTIVFASGGMDSRAILFSSGNKERTVGFNMYDRVNNEASIARQLCESAGVTYHGFGRDNDYYPRWHEGSVRLGGGMISTEDSHYLGVRDEVMKLGARTVMSGCTTDWLFKGYGVEKCYQRLFGRNLPLQEFTDERIDAFLPNLPLPVGERVRHDVEERRAAVFEGTPRVLRSDRDRLLVEDRRIRPICYAPSVSSQIMYRIFPYDTFLADRRVADCYSRMRAEWKLNSVVWGVAVRQICVGGTHISDANFGWRVGSNRATKLLAFARGWITRRLNKPRPKELELATDGSWPNLGWYALHSPTLARQWNGVPKVHRKLIASLMSENPWDRPLSEWAARPNDLFRILTVASHLQQDRTHGRPVGA